LPEAAGDEASVQYGPATPVRVTLLGRGVAVELVGVSRRQRPARGSN
jgi:hypothetical protein